MYKIGNKDEQVEFLRDVLEEMVHAVVHDTDAVYFEEKVLHDTYVVGVMVAPSDMGLLLGRKGSTASAIRHILFCACKKTDFRIEIVFGTKGNK